MNTQHPSYRPGDQVPADGSYYLKPATLVAVVSLDTDGDAVITTTEDALLWVHDFKKGEILPYLDGRDPDPMWVLIKKGPR